ncbi:DNA adenine methylase [Comamonas aquatica]|uniref:DNA adenine methylase n=1 Tax=Comamonas aquatica TaxID=225991 RepID=UPI0024492725|nr:DNA adenine methylase [Comamonas aquatica]MDH0380648.1 DNA adenine methylase [Comamonas aquatica]MDH0429187.1 DNA adenine methylase [Comamonas aquatica]MDH0940033.1 DNA adenine methylase [Comamonas aquatica]
MRYPGGKSQIVPLIIDILRKNDLVYGEYVEPFAGGAGIAMTLLLNSYVSKVYLNDIDPAIHAFWHSVLNDTARLCELITTTPVTMDTWHQQRSIFLNPTCADLTAKGFATLFLNRTNRSGILRGGVIGGLAQNGNYKLDCRFNRTDLVRKIKRIAQHSDMIELHSLDAVAFVNTIVPTTSEHTLVNLDPPYYGKGPELYTNFYKHKDHVALAQAVSEIKRPWMVTYDDTPEIRQLYSQYRNYSSNLNYSVQTKRIGVELLVANDGLLLPDAMETYRMQTADSDR